jgi:hypothetical protein
LLRGRRNRQRDPFVRNRLGNRHAEHRIGCRPRRQPVNLGTDHALQEAGRGLGKIDGAKQRLIRPHDDLDPAAAKRGLPFVIQCRLRTAIHQTERCLRQACALARGCNSRGKVFRLAFHQQDAPLRHNPGRDRLDRGGDGRDPDCE